jgi:hypothetical protein
MRVWLTALASIQPKTAFGEKVPNDLGKRTKDLDFGDQKSAERDRIIEHWEPKWKSQGAAMKILADYLVEVSE